MLDVLDRAGHSRLPAFNEAAAERLREAATLLSYQGDNPYRVAAYRRAGDAVAAQTADLRALLEAGGIEALEEIPGVGRRIAGGLAELARTGRWTYLERLRGSAEPHDVFCTIPGVGPILSKRLHETLHVETLEQLEAALHEKSANAVAGIGPRRLAILRAALAQMLARIRAVRTGPADEPPVDMLLDIDREYRTKATANELRTIAPKRFNPKGEAWLPILHTGRDKWHFTALFSNTARAHELRKVRDWVVIYFHSDSGGEAQRTIVTETRGPLVGQRVVRGRERECLAAYESPSSAEREKS
jgi:predicted flap endonuclease-1-like 5' DNA nuclease